MIGYPDWNYQEFEKSCDYSRQTTACCLLIPSGNRWYVEAIKSILNQSMSG